LLARPGASFRALFLFPVALFLVTALFGGAYRPPGRSAEYGAQDLRDVFRPTFNQRYQPNHERRQAA
jgi:hypothetical protein